MFRSLGQINLMPYFIQCLFGQHPHLKLRMCLWLFEVSKISVSYLLRASAGTENILEEWALYCTSTMLDLETDAWIIFNPSSLAREQLLFLPWHIELENFKFPNFWPEFDPSDRNKPTHLCQAFILEISSKNIQRKVSLVLTEVMPMQRRKLISFWSPLICAVCIKSWASLQN